MEKRQLVTPFRELRLEEVVVRKHIHTACLFILALVASGAVLVHLRAVLVPFVLAMGLFYSLLPIVDLLSSQPSTRRSMSNRGCLNTPVRKNDRVCGYDEDDYKGRADVPAHIKLVISITVWIRRCRLPRVRLSTCLSLRVVFRASHMLQGSGRDGVQILSILRLQILSILRRFAVASGIRAQPVAVVVALILACIFIAILVVVVISSVNELAGHAEKYTQRINAMVQWVVRWGEVLGMDISNQGLTEKLTHHTAFLSELVVRTFSIVAEELSNGFLMLLFTVYLLLGYATSTQDSHRVSGVRAEIDTQVQLRRRLLMLLPVAGVLLLLLLR